MRQVAGLLVLAALGACATPGVDYATTVVPANTAAVETRTVDVGEFRGPGGRWYEGAFMDMLATASLDGQPWFRMARHSDGYVPEGERAGIYEGYIEVTDYRGEEFTEWETKCVEWDGIFDCEHREEVEVLCLREEIEVAVTPRLVELGTGEILFQHTYYGSASQETCEEGWQDFAGDLLLGFVGVGSAPRDMIVDALSDTLQDVRVDIAPRNATMRAVFVEEAIDPMVRHDPRFENAVKAGSKSPDFSCYMWEDMKAEYPDAPAVTHNLGACREAQGRFVEAHGLYAEAAELSAKQSPEGQAAKPFRDALSRMSYHRSGLQLLDRLTASDRPWQPMEEDGWKPVETLEGGPAEDEAGS